MLKRNNIDVGHWLVKIIWLVFGKQIKPKLEKTKKIIRKFHTKKVRWSILL